MEIGTDPLKHAEALGAAAWFEVVDDIEKKGLPVLVIDHQLALFGDVVVRALQCLNWSGV